MAPHPTGETSIILAVATTDAQRAAIGNQTGGRVGLFLHTDDFDEGGQIKQEVILRGPLPKYQRAREFLRRFAFKIAFDEDPALRDVVPVWAGQLAAVFGKAAVGADGRANTQKHAIQLGVYELLAEHAIEPFDAVIVNPVYMIGPWDWKPSSGRMLLEVGAGKGLFAPPGSNDFVDVRDVAAGILDHLPAVAPPMHQRRVRQGNRQLRSGGNPADRRVRPPEGLRCLGPPPAIAAVWESIQRDLRREKPPKRTFTRLGLMHSYTSCYAGTLTRSSLGRLEGGLSESERLRLLSIMAHQRSRMVLTSGGVEPVLDSAGGGHSAWLHSHRSGTPR